eukprot:jgi/Chrzof1/4305/Cz14g08080.t1
MVSHSHLLCVVPVTAAASCSPRGIWSLPAPSYTSSVVDPTQPTATTALAAATAPAAYTPLSTIRVLAPDLVPASPATPHGKRPVECAGGDSFRITDSVDDCLKAAANKKPPGASKRTFQGLQQQLDHVISTPAGMMGGATAAEQASDAAGDDGSMVRPHRRSKSNLHRSHLIFSPGGMVSQDLPVYVNYPTADTRLHSDIRAAYTGMTCFDDRQSPPKHKGALNTFKTASQLEATPLGLTRATMQRSAEGLIITNGPSGFRKKINKMLHSSLHASTSGLTSDPLPLVRDAMRTSLTNKGDSHWVTTYDGVHSAAHKALDMAKTGVVHGVVTPSPEHWSLG